MLCALFLFIYHFQMLPRVGFEILKKIVLHCFLY